MPRYKPHSLETKLKMSKSHKGLNTWSKGRKLSEEHKRKIKENHAHAAFKGNNIKYAAIHMRLKTQRFKPKECVYCGEDKKRIEWAAISHIATTNLDDYIPLCVKCHRIYDDNWIMRRITYA